MKVIFRITRDMPVASRRDFAQKIRDCWNAKDYDHLICYASDVEVIVVDDDSELEIENEQQETEDKR